MMGPPRGALETGNTDPALTVAVPAIPFWSHVMNKIALVLKSLALSALLATSAFAGGERVNINTADAVTLDRVLVGIGPSKAEAIVVYRKANGAFRSADQLASVKGIGLATIEKNRDRIVVSGAAPPAAARKGTAKPAAKPALAARSGAAR
jgi:competence protein ComEA